MSKNIYELLCDVQTDMTEYEKKELTEVENQYMKRHFRNKFVRSNKIKGIVACSAAIAIVAVSSVTPARAAVGSTVQSLYSRISTFMGIKQDDTVKDVVTEYQDSAKMENVTLKIDDKECEMNSDVEITLCEAVLDGSKLIVDLNYYIPGVTSDENIDFTGFASITVNGTEIDGVYIQDRKIVDADHMNMVCSYDLSTVGDLSGNVNVNIKSREIRYFKDNMEHQIFGTWSKDFTVNRDTLEAMTVYKDIAQDIKVSDDFVIHLNKTRTNQFGQRIDFTYEGEITQKTHNKAGEIDVFGSSKYDDVLLEGTDNLGNKVAFILFDLPENGKGQFVYDFDSCQGTGPMNPDATSFTLQATGYIPVNFGEDGTYESKAEKIGEPFTIEIPK